MSNRSVSALLEFLDYLAAKGMMQRNTVSGRKAAVSKVFGVLDPEEQGDVTQVNIDEAMTRFFNLEGRGYKPESLGVYKSRVNSAVNDFKAYLESPSTFKPSGGAKATRTAPRVVKVTAGQPKPVHSSEAHVRYEQPVSTGANVFPIPIRPDVVVRIHGLPFDLTSAEADKIANVVKAMAME